MDRYELLKPIGAGKSAEVFKARRKADGALVALKRVAIGAMDERGRAKCLKEVGAAGVGGWLIDWVGLEWIGWGNGGARWIAIGTHPPQPNPTRF